LDLQLLCLVQYLLGSYTTPELGCYRTPPLVTLAISALISLRASWSAFPSSYFLWAFASDIYDLDVSCFLNLLHVTPSSPIRILSSFLETKQREEVRKEQETKWEKRKRRLRLTQVVPPAPIAVVVKQQYLLLHLQSLELSIVLQVSFLQLPFVIVYLQLGVFGTEVVPNISIPRYEEYQREEKKK
jgi:hypothetical protein